MEALPGARSAAGPRPSIDVITHPARAVLIPTAIFAVAACTLSGQPRPLEFAAASIRVNRGGPDGRPRGKITVTPGRLSIVSMQLRPIIAWAYRVQPSQVAGPALLQTDWYDIIATAPGAVEEDKIRLMAQNLLRVRFRLALHRKTQAMPAYILTRDKGPLKLHESTGDTHSGEDAASSALINLKRAAVGRFVDLLTAPLKSPVLDRTGLTGLYDFKLDIAPYLEGSGRDGVDDSKLDIPDILSQAVHDELGLKLQLRTVPIEILLVDRVESPSEN